MRHPLASRGAVIASIAAFIALVLAGCGSSPDTTQVSTAADQTSVSCVDLSNQWPNPDGSVSIPADQRQAMVTYSDTNGNGQLDQSELASSTPDGAQLDSTCVVQKDPTHGNQPEVRYITEHDNYPDYMMLALLGANARTMATVGLLSGDLSPWQAFSIASMANIYDDGRYYHPYYYDNNQRGYTHVDRSRTTVYNVNYVQDSGSKSSQAYTPSTAQQVRTKNKVQTTPPVDTTKESDYTPSSKGKPATAKTVARPATAKTVAPAANNSNTNGNAVAPSANKPATPPATAKPTQAPPRTVAPAKPASPPKAVAPAPAKPASPPAKKSGK